MNVFYINEDPVKAAQELCDEHVRKMQIESAQMLCTAHWLLGKEAPYKKSHVNHPSTKWVRESIENYRWLVEHGLAICEEFTRRHGTYHKTKDVLNWCKQNEPQIPSKGFLPPPQCMPDQYKNQDTVEAYKTFYIEDKVKVKNLSWKKLNNIPDWAKQRLEHATAEKTN